MRLIDADELIKYCEKAADTSLELEEKALKIERADGENLGAIAYFDRMNMMYRYTIVGLINNFCSKEMKKSEE